MSPIYEIEAHARGTAVFEVEAANEEEAEQIAYKEHLTDIMIDGGEADWMIDAIVEVEE